ncbi:MAG TPA: hypothetical protein P5096_03835 [Patescibacteria group bacterium]|nr:hypothetical protein [Patescibacteria group bacterium]
MLDQNDLEKIKGIVDGSIKESEKRVITLLSQKISDEVNGLAVIVDKNFKRVDKKLDDIDNRFEQVDKRFGILEGKLDGLAERLDFVEKKIDSMGIMEKAIIAEIKAVREKLKTKVDSKDFLDLDIRVKKLEKAAFAKIH